MLQFLPVDALSFERLLVVAFVRAEDDEFDGGGGRHHVTVVIRLLHLNSVLIRLHRRLYTITHPAMPCYATLSK